MDRWAAHATSLPIHWDEIGNEVPFLIGHVAVRCPPCTIGLFRCVRNEYQHSCCVRPAGGKWVLQERKLSEQPLRQEGHQAEGLDIAAGRAVLAEMRRLAGVGGSFCVETNLAGRGLVQAI